MGMGCVNNGLMVIRVIKRDFHGFKVILRDIKVMMGDLLLFRGHHRGIRF